ncbi:cytochrome c biogenesis CcdA family protein [Halococcus salifodinae]|uniref:Cytochrome c biogenesis protein transmembrane region n=1 Tax=Halococcus salifodinae DSM 8989 TaxID=1227456 RepID=M0N6A9_9EURY|nr:cytochrome c biogenesis protein CcdA [Halococcus salifodinae]EMA52230.1 cytochrome c biogenesis protein transmembrane region [Halococcus salifodinae DSM 8989]
MIDLAELRLGFAFTAGAATFFAPCAYPLLPGYVAYYLGSDVDDERERDGESEKRGERVESEDESGASAGAATASRLRRAAVVGVLVSLGFVLVYGALAGVVASVGTQVLANVVLLELVVGALLVLLGTAMALGRGPTLHVAFPERRRSPLAFVGFGIVYAAAAAGCTAPVFIAVALTALSSGPATAFVTLGAYAAGMSVLIIAITALSALGREAVLRRLPRPRTVSRVAGVFLVAAGLAQVYLFLFRFGGLALLGLK